MDFRFSFCCRVVAALRSDRRAVTDLPLRGAGQVVFFGIRHLRHASRSGLQSLVCGLVGCGVGAGGTSTQRPHVVSARETFSPQRAHTALAAAATEACTCVQLGRLRPSAPPGVSADVSIGRSRVDDPRRAQTLSGGTLTSCSNTYLACPQRVRHDAAPVRSHRALTSLLHRRRCCSAAAAAPPLCAECAPCSMLAKRVVLPLLLACMPRGTAAC